MSDDPAPGPDPALLRASNDDRERVASVLNKAMAEGRINIHELQERLDLVYAAKTIGQLEPVTRDLPEHQTLVPVRPRMPQPAAGTPVGRVGGEPTSTVAVAVMSGTARKGEWVVPARFTAVAVMGGIELDLTKAGFAASEVTITAVSIMSGIDIIVPEEVIVKVDGVGLMGAFESSISQQTAPAGAVIVRITGVAIMGAVDVHRPKNSRVQLTKD